MFSRSGEAWRLEQISIDSKADENIAAKQSRRFQRVGLMRVFQLRSALKWGTERSRRRTNVLFVGLCVILTLVSVANADEPRLNLVYQSQDPALTGTQEATKSLVAESQAGDKAPADAQAAESSTDAKASGEAESASKDQDASEEDAPADKPKRKKPKSLDEKLENLGRLYKDDDNPVMQELWFLGRYHGQYYDAESDTAQQDEWENRRFRIGSQGKFFDKLTLHAQMVSGRIWSRFTMDSQSSGRSGLSKTGSH